MADAALDSVSRFIRRLVVKSAYQELNDSQLLQKFLTERDEAAFAALVHRHGSMVWHVCKNVLHHVQDSEDAFQATFLVLAGNPAKVGKPEALSSWLHGVALRFALEAKRKAARRRAHESKAAVGSAESGEADISWGEVRQVLDEEIQNLPEKYRLPFVLCVLEEHSAAKAAQQLGWKVGTVSGRLSLARKRLRDRLSRRGIEFSAVLAAITVGNEAAWASLPLGLAARTVRAAMACPLHSGSAVGLASTSWNTFVQGATNAMSMSTNKLKITVFLSLVLTALTGWSIASSRSSAEAESAHFDSAVRVPTAAPSRQAKQEECYSGTILDAMTGKPVSDVKVLVQRMVNGKPDGKIELTSDADGRFRFELPAAWVSSPEAKLAVEIDAPRGQVAFPSRWGDRFAIGELRRQQKLGIPPYFERMLLFPIKQIRGRLQTPDGKPAEAVDVVASSVHLKDETANSVVRRTKTDKEGRFTAEVACPGPVVLHFLTERYAERNVKLIDAEGDLGTYKLEEGVEVSGKLRDVRNQPLPGRWVRVGKAIGSGEDVERWCRTDPDGTFRTAPLPAGEYQASAYGVDVVPDRRTGRKRLGEPLEACIVPQKVVVRKGRQTPERVILQAVPHVKIEIRVTDEDGKTKGNILAAYRYRFDGKMNGDAQGSFDQPTVRDGKLVIWIPHGASWFELDFNLGEPDGTVCWKQKRDDDRWYRENVIYLLNVVADRTVDFVWKPCTDASLRVSSKDGSPLKGVEVYATHSNMAPCYAVPAGDGIYWIRAIQKNRPLKLSVKAEGYETAYKEVPVANDSPGRIEITLEKKK